ncbi:endonuclease dU [Halorubrum pallidum]
MRPPSRTLGIAFSDGDRISRVAGAVVRSDGTLDGLGFERCTVGGTDATDAVIDLVDALDRDDVRHVACDGIAPAWFNFLDLRRLRETLDVPVYSVSYEPSPGLKPALREAFDGDALASRLAAYRSLPPRTRVETDGANEADPLFVRGVGLDGDAAATAARGLVREGFRRPEPLRLAGVAASAHREAVETDAGDPDDPA